MKADKQIKEECPDCLGTTTIRKGQDVDKVRATHQASCPGLYRSTNRKKPE